MQSMKVGKGKWKGYALVRDKYGKPKIDDIDNCPQQILDMLTPEELKELKDGSHTSNNCA